MAAILLLPLSLTTSPDCKAQAIRSPSDPVVQSNNSNVDGCPVAQNINANAIGNYCGSGLSQNEVCTTCACELVSRLRDAGYRGNITKSIARSCILAKQTDLAQNGASIATLAALSECSVLRCNEQNATSDASTSASSNAQSVRDTLRYRLVHVFGFTAAVFAFVSIVLHILPKFIKRQSTSSSSQSGVIGLFENTTGLHNLDILLSPGEMVAMSGPSGVGKSSALQLLAGFLPVPQSNPFGNVHNLKKHPNLRDERIVLLPTNTAAIEEYMTLDELIGFWSALEDTELSKATKDEKISSLSLSHARHRYFGELSKGEQMRAMIAPALSKRYHLLLLDEVFAPLDVESAIATANALRSTIDARRKCALITFHPPSTQSAVSSRQQSSVLPFFDRVIALPSSRQQSDINIRMDAKTNPLHHMEAENVRSRTAISMVQRIFIACIQPLPTQAPLLLQLRQLLWRDYKLYMRRKRLMLVHLGTGIGLGSFIACGYHSVQHDLDGLRAISGASFFLLLALSTFTQSAANPMKRKLLDEHCTYTARHCPGAMLFTGLISDFFFLRLLVIVPAVAIAYPSIGLEGSISRVVIYTGTLLVFQCFWSAFNTAIGLLVPVSSASVAPLLCTVFAIATSPFSEFLGSIKSLGWLQWLSPFFYSWNAMMSSQLQGRMWRVGTAIDGFADGALLDGATVGSAWGVQVGQEEVDLCMITLLILVVTFISHTFLTLRARLQWQFWNQSNVA